VLEVQINSIEDLRLLLIMIPDLFYEYSFLSRQSESACIRERAVVEMDLLSNKTPLWAHVLFVGFGIIIEGNICGQWGKTE
jgi:hypothetical protein